MKAWVTKYALTKGVFEVDGEVDGAMITVRTAGGFPQHFHGNDWHRSEAVARERVREMIDAKLFSIEKQQAKLEKLKKKYA